MVGESGRQLYLGIKGIGWMLYWRKPEPVFVGGGQMKWASAIAEQPSLESALSECAASIREQLGEAPQLAVAFVSPHYQADYARVGPLLGDLLGSEHTFGCSGGGIIGAGVEVEQRPALSVTRRHPARGEHRGVPPGGRQPAGPRCRAGQVAGPAFRVPRPGPRSSCCWPIPFPFRCRT